MPIASKKQWRYLVINDKDLFDKFQKESPVKFEDLPDRVEEDFKKIKETEEIGLVSNKNLDELLNDSEIKSYFKEVDSFDKFYNDINEFFKSDFALTINQLNQYLDNLGYGPKCIEKSIEILGKSEEERSAEKKEKSDKPEEKVLNKTIKEYNQSMSKENDPLKLIESFNLMNNEIIKSKILEDLYED
jgi:hypothetical protein